MSLDPLATVADLELRLGRILTDAEADRANALLLDTSAAVRSWTGQVFTVATDTVRLKPQGVKVRLPQRPVTAVNDVTGMDGDPVGFTWYSGDTILLDFAPTVGWVDVDYDHGYEEIPDDIIAVVCNITGRAFGTPADEGGYASETIGTYSYSVGAAAAAGSAGMLNDERAVLDRYRRPGGIAWLYS